jgi:hypothetical protein
LVAAEAEKALLRTIAAETASFVLLNILYLHGRASRPDEARFMSVMETHALNPTMHRKPAHG